MLKNYLCYYLRISLHSLQANLEIRIKHTDKWIGSEVFQPLQVTVI